MHMILLYSLLVFELLSLLILYFLVNLASKLLSFRHCVPPGNFLVFWDDIFLHYWVISDFIISSNITYVQTIELA